jgi:PAS domain S-box-containing protein
MKELEFTPKVLVVDDEKRIRDACRKMLTRDGFEVAVAEDGEEGLERIESEHFDLILLDLMMPGLSGFDVLERVKALHPDTAIIVITGYATVEHSIEAMKKGAFDFIPKPFSPQDLRLVISKALEYIRTLKDIANEKSRMRVLINYLQDGVMATDADKNIALANPAFVKMMGRPGEEVIGQPADQLVEIDRVREMIDQALTTESEKPVEVVEEIDLDDQVLAARAVPFCDRVGRTLGTVTVLHDITTAKKMDQMKNDFVSMVSHEIRSPLNSVLMQLKVVLDGLAGDLTEKQRDILSRSSGRIKSLVDLSTELLDLARIESGLITQEKEKVDPNQLLADQVEFHRPEAQAKKQTLVLADHPQLPPLWANRQNIDEVLSNLITNAIHYTPEGGTITVDAKTENDYLALSVQDNGLGIPEEERDRIFSRFYRVKNENTRHITGTGLGLPIVKSIVEAHQGRIKLESAEDEGTTFYVYLPLIEQ